jgi:hypothetical protein
MAPVLHLVRLVQITFAVLGRVTSKETLLNCCYMIILNRLKMALVVVLMATSLAHADDASIKKQLLGYWRSPRHGYLLKSNGIMYMLPRPGTTTTNTWDVRNGFFYQDGEALKIVALNRFQFMYQQTSGDQIVFTLDRATAAQANRD